MTTNGTQMAFYPAAPQHYGGPQDDHAALWRNISGEMLCPFCGANYTHLDEVSFGYRESFGGPRREDAPVNTATFNARAGELRLSSQRPVEYSGRRHWIELHVDCESCPGGTIVLAQHKGVTQFTLVPREGNGE